MLYGVTGSGKTHTVFGNLGYREGSQADSQENGIVYHCFKKLTEQTDCELRASYLEIYNEQVKDLLSDEDNLMLAENTNGEVVVQGLSQPTVSTFAQLIGIVKSGNLRRKMAKTCANAFSSRSHAILQITIRRRVEQGYTRTKLSFIDLAGSERVQLTQNKGIRLAEGSNINKSLLALGKVITALSDRQGEKYVNFRDSKLTRLLKDSLGGNTKTVLLTCISTHSQQVDETIHSLNYAARAKRIKLKVNINIESHGQTLAHTDNHAIIEANDQHVSEIAMLKDQIGMLQQELALEKGGRSQIELNYRVLVKDIEEQWELKASIIEVGEIIATHQDKLTLKKKQLVNEDSSAIKQKRICIDEIRNLEEIIRENIEIKLELEKRLFEIEDKKAKKLGLSKRSVSPLFVSRAIMRSNKGDSSITDKSLACTKSQMNSQTLSDRATEKKTSTKTVPLSLIDRVIADNSIANDSVNLLQADNNCMDKARQILDTTQSIYQSTNNMTNYDIHAVDYDLGDLPTSSAKQSVNIKKMLNFDAVTIDVPVFIRPQHSPVEPAADADYSSMHRQFVAYSQNPTTTVSPNPTTKDHKVQQKLQQAREKMREFKKKLNLMGSFLIKYEDKAIKRGSVDIIKAVSVLLDEHKKHGYLLSEDESANINHMESFVHRFQYNYPQFDQPLYEMTGNISDNYKENIDPGHLLPSELKSSRGILTSNFSIVNVEDKPLMSKAEIKEKYHSTLKQSNRVPHNDDLSKTDLLISKINKLLN
jgi:Kinesin motor domain